MGNKKNKSSNAHANAVKRYDDKTYDFCGVKLKKGIKPAILEAGYTINGYITRAVLNQMEADGITICPSEESE